MTEQPNQQTDETMVVIGGDLPPVDTCSLVLMAIGIPHRIDRQSDGSRCLIVPALHADRARTELHHYVDENRNWPPLEPIAAQTVVTTPPSLLLIGSLAVFYLVTGPWHHESYWFSRGCGDASAIIYHGQWYRLLTALTLHADVSHLAGNSLIGLFLLHFFLQIHGTGIGLISLLLAAMLGNYLNVLIHGGDHLFVGFSTAIFSIIGMLSTHQALTRRRPFSMGMLTPLLAGAALLAMLGSSGQRTDLGGHLFGLFAGLCFGAVLAAKPFRKLVTIPFMQALALLAAGGLTALCWGLALSG